MHSRYRRLPPGGTKDLAIACAGHQLAAWLREMHSHGSWGCTADPAACCCRGCIGEDAQAELRLLQPDVGKWEDLDLQGTARPLPRTCPAATCQGDQVCPSLHLAAVCACLCPVAAARRPCAASLPAAALLPSAMAASVAVQRSTGLHVRGDAVAACPILQWGCLTWHIIRGDMQVFLFGGQAPGGEQLNDLWCLDILKRQWTQLTPVQSAGCASYTCWGC